MIYFRNLSVGQTASFLKNGTRFNATEVTVTPAEMVATLKSITFGRPDAHLVVMLRGMTQGRYVLSMTSTRAVPGHPADCGSSGFRDPPDWLVGAVNGIVPPAPEAL